MSETIWTRPDRGARGPEPTHSRADLCSVALTLADSRGLSAVTMRAVADALGTTAGSLYRYLSSRNDLLDLMVDTVLVELELPSGSSDWLDDLAALAQGQLELYRRHPWLRETAQQPRVLGPNVLVYLEHCLTLMAGLSVSTTAKLEAVAMITGVVILFSNPPENVISANPFELANAHSHPQLMVALADAAPASPSPDLFDRTIRSVLLGVLGQPEISRDR